MEFLFQITHVELEFIDMAGKALALGDELSLEFCSTAADAVCDAWEYISHPPLEYVPLFTADVAAPAPLPSCSSLPEQSDAATESCTPPSHSCAASPLQTPAEDSAAGPLPGSSPLSGADLIPSEAPALPSSEVPAVFYSEAPALLLTPDDTSSDIIHSAPPACAEVISTPGSSCDPSSLLVDDAPATSTGCPSSFASTSDESESEIVTPPRIITSTVRFAEDAATSSSEDSGSATGSEGSEFSSGESSTSSSPMSSPPTSPRPPLTPVTLSCDTFQEYLQKVREQAKMKKSHKKQKNHTKHEKRAAKRAQGA